MSAAGNVTGLFGHTHAAYTMGRIAVETGTRHTRRGPIFDAKAILRVVFTDPEIATVGIDECDAGPNARVAYLPLSEVDRARTTGDERGLVRLVAGPRRLLGHAGGGRILGATIVCGRSTHSPQR